jgi:hypothetical protein
MTISKNVPRNCVNMEQLKLKKYLTKYVFAAIQTSMRLQYKKKHIKQVNIVESVRKNVKGSCGLMSNNTN